MKILEKSLLNPEHCKTFHSVIICVNEVNYSGHIRHTLKGRVDEVNSVLYCFCVFGLSVSIDLIQSSTMTGMNVRDRLTMLSMASAVKSSYITYIFP